MGNSNATITKTAIIQYLFNAIFPPPFYLNSLIFCKDAEYIDLPDILTSFTDIA